MKQLSGGTSELQGKSAASGCARLFVFLFFLIFALGLQRAAIAGPPRLALRTSVEAPGDAILLSSLLPASAENSMRALAARVSLGASPQTGSTRILSRDAVTAALNNCGLHASSFEIPESITVSRPGHLVSREAVYSAILQAPASKSFPQISELRPADLNFDASMRTPSKDTPFMVRKTSYDPFIACLRFQIQPKTVPASLPFYVTAHVRFAPDTSFSSSPATTASASPTLPPSASPTLVEPGQLAHLHLHSSHFDTVLNVRPLQRGHLGELIRVRLPGSGKTVQAHVVGLGSLDESI
jgi:hypothetical protein